MSYCRFSSDFWDSDIYAYESCNGGVDVHVAGSRYEFDPKFPYPHHVWFPGKTVEQIKRDVVEQETAMAHARTMPIDLPSAGMSRTGLTYRAAYEWLLELRAEGFHVPQHALDRLEEDVKEADE